MAYVTSLELQTQLEQLAQDLGVSVQELLTSYYTKGEIDTTINSITSRLDAIDVIDANDGIDTLAEKIKTINDLLTDPSNQTLATDLLNRITTNDANIAAEATRATSVEAGLRADVDTANAGVTQNAADIASLNSTISANSAASDAADAALDARVTATEGDIVTLKGDKTVAGSVDNKIEQERLRAVAAENALAGQITTATDATLSQSNTYTDNAVLTVSDALDVERQRINTLEGDKTVIGSVDNKIETNRVAAEAVMDSKVAASKALSDAADANLQSQIDSLAGTGTGSLGDLESRVSTIEGDLNDTTDANGNLVKGVKTKVADNSAAIATEESSRVNADANLQSQIDALQGSGLATGVIDGRVAANKFRAVFGLAALSTTTGL